MSHTQVWAHRGASAYAPENTMPAFIMAARMGADGIETDVHLTTDGEIVICHDDVLDRVSNGTGPVCEKSLAQLRELDFSAGKEGYRDTGIVTLRELYAFAKDTDLFINVEMKYSGTRWDETNEKTAAIAGEFGMENRVLYSSFKPEPLLKLKKLVPSQVALLYSESIERPWELARERGFAALHPRFDLIRAQNMPEACRAAGIRLHPWTVDAPADIRTAYESGVDALITNTPDVALKIRREFPGE